MHIFFAESRLPEVVLGFDDSNRNITTIQCFVNITHGNGIVVETDISLMRNNVVLRNVEFPSLWYHEHSLSLDVSREEQNSGNYTCLLEVNVGPGVSVSSSHFTKIRGTFFDVFTPYNINF